MGKKKEKKGAKDSFSAFSQQSTTLLKTYTQKLQPDRRLFPSQKCLFPLLDTFELDVNWKFTLVAVIIETLQLCGLVVNSQIPWGTVVDGVLDKVFYFFILPFFDETWIKGLIVVWYVLVVGLLAIAILAMIIVVFFTRSNVHSMPSVVRFLLKYFMHLVPGILAIPIFSILSATGSCDRTYSIIYWDSNQCFSGLGGAFHFISYVTMLLYLALMYLSVGFCFDDMPDTTNLAARPRSTIHAVMVGAKIIPTLLFHILIPMEEGLAFTIVFAVIAIAVLVMNVMILPYYDMLMNQLRGCQWGVTTGVVITAVINECMGESYTTKIYSLIILLVLGVIGGVGGFFLPLIRRNSKFSKRMSLLNHGGVPITDPPEYPTRLPMDDLALSKYPRIEKLLIGHHKDEESLKGPKKQGATRDSGSLNDLDPYLSTIIMPSDVEVATRYLREYASRSADSQPTKSMVLFAARIFTKGMAKYPNDPQLQYLFCMFLAVSAKKLRMSLTELTLLQRNAGYISIPLSYRIYRLTERLKTSLNMLNSTHIHLASISAELHREIIGAMSSFWGCLANGTQSTVDLTEIADYITAKRENCKSFYDSTLQSPSETILLNYSTFLRDVMLDEEGAAALKERVLEEVELRRTRRANRHNNNRGGSLSSSRNNDNWNSCKLMVKTAQQRQKFENGDDEAGLAHSKDVSRMRLTVYIVFGFIFAMAVGLLVFILIRMTLLSKAVRRIENSAERNAYFMYGVYLTNQLSQFYGEPNTDDYIASLKATLLTISGKVYDDHYALTLGNLKTNYPIVDHFSSDPRIPWVQNGVLSIEGDYKRQLGELFDLGFTVSAKLQSIGSTPPGQAPSEEDISYILTNANNLDQGFNFSTNTYIQHRVHIIESTKWVVVVLCTVSIFLLLCIFALILLFVHRIEISKESIINLFLVIPKSYVKALYQKSWEKVHAVANESNLMMESDSEENETDEEGDAEEESPKEKPLPGNVSGTNPLGENAPEQSAGEEANPVVTGPVTLTTAEEEEAGEGEMMEEHYSVGEKSVGLHAKSAAFILDDDMDDDYQLTQAEKPSEYQDKECMTTMTSAINNFFLNPIVVFSIVIICVVLGAVCFGMMYSLNAVSNTAIASYEKNILFYGLMEGFYSYFAELTRVTQQYIITGDLVHPQRYYYFVVSSDVNGLFMQGTYEFSDLKTIEAVLNIETVINSATSRQQIALWLASSTAAYGAKITDDKKYIFTRINGVDQTYDYTILATLLSQLFAPYNPQTPTTPTVSTNTIDSARSDAEKMDVATNLVFDDYYQDHRFLLLKYVNDFVSSKSNDDENSHKLQIIYWYISLITGCICFVLLVIILREAIVKRRNVFVLTGVVTCMALVLAFIVFLALAKKKIDTAFSQNSFTKIFAYATNMTNGNLLASQGYALRMVLYGYDSTELLWDDLFSNNVENLLSDVLYSSVKSQKGSAAYYAAMNMTSAYDSIEHIMYYSSIAAQIALMIYPALPISPYLEGFSYNIELESNYQLSLYSCDVTTADLYSSTETDAAITDLDTLKMKAKSAVAGERFDFVSKDYFTTVNTVIDEVNANLNSGWSSLKSSLSTLTLVAMALGAVFLGIIVLLLVNMGYSVFMSETMNKQHKTVSKHQVVKKIRTRTAVVFKLFSSIAVLIILYAVLLAVFMTKTETDRNESNSYKTVHSRLTTALEVLTAAQNVWYGQGSNSPKSPFTVPFIKILRYAVSYLELLYLGDGGSFEGVLHQNFSADVALFGSATYEYKEYNVNCENFEVEKGYSLLDYDTSIATDSPSQEDLDKLFYYGSENVWFQYLVAFGNMAGNYGSAQRLALINPVTSTADAFVTRTRAIFQAFYSSEDNHAQLVLYVFIVVNAVLLVAIGVVLFAVIIPLLRHLVQEEEGTRLLIRMIPENIRRDVPMLHDFFENGSVNPDIQLLTDVCASVETSAMIVVREDDRIVDVTDEALRRFMYTKEEMVGALFDRVLSPERAKAMMDYRGQMGTSRLKVVVGKTIRSAGMRSDGTVFPVELFIREVPASPQNPETLYVLRMRNVDSECLIELTRRIHNSLSESSQHPILVMDANGLIRVSNKACENLFGLESRDLVGEHVTVLFNNKEENGMFTLTQYLNKVRNADTSCSATIQVIGKGKHDMDMPLMLSLSSIVNEDKVVTYIVAAMRDMTTHFKAKQISAATRSAIAASPVPVVLFDRTGRIVAFSPAAERSWGYSVDRALRLRINDLLHESDAQRFNFTDVPNSDLKFFLGVSRALVARRSSGERFVIEARMKEMITEKGDEAIICYFKDLSKEMEISHRNIMSQAAFDMCPVSVIVIDGAGEVKGVNRAAEKLFGYRANVIVGQNVKILMPDNIANKHDEFLYRYAQTGIKNVLNAPRREYAKRADGRLFAVEIHVIELEVDDVLSETGSRKLFVGYIRDMSEQYQMQRANEINDAITQHCPTPIISIDKNGIVLSFNPAASKLFEYSASAVIGKNITMLMPERYAREHDTYVQRAARLRSAAVDSMRDVVGLTASKVEIPVRIHVMELKKGVVDPVYVASVKDLSVKSKIQDECKLEQAFISQYPRSIIVANRRGVVKFFSEGAAKAFAFPSTESAVGTNFLALINADDFRQREAFLAELMDVDSPTFGLPRKTNCVRRNGVPFIANITAKRVELADVPRSGLDKSNMDISIVLILDDLTSEGLLQKSSDIHEELLQKFDYGTAQLDETATITAVNAPLLRELKFNSKVDVVGKKINTIIGGEIGTTVLQQINAYSATGVEGPIFTQTLEFQLVRHDRSKVHIELVVRPIMEEKRLSFLVYLRNINATFSDRNHRKLIRDVIDTSPIPALVVRYGWKKGAGLVGEDGTIYVSNNATLEQFQFSLDELTGKHLQSILTPTGRGSRSLTEQFHVASKGDQKTSGRDEHSTSLVSLTTYAIGMRKDRSTFPVRVSIMESFDVERNHASLFLFLEETTELIKQQVNCGIGSAAASICPLSIVCCNMAGDIVLFTEQAEAMFGCTEQEVLSKPASILVDTRSCGNWLTKMQDRDKSLTKQPLFLPRVIGKKRDGSLLSLEITMYETDGGTEQERLFVSLIRDTTTELADNLAGQLSQVAMMSFGMPFIVTSSAGMIELVNDAFSELVLYTKDELLRNTIKILLTPEIARRCDQYAQGTEDMNKNSLVYSRIKRKDGREIPVEILIGVYRSHGKTSMYAFLTSLEESADLKREYTLTEVIATMEKMAVLYVDANGTIKDCTTSASRFFNFMGEDMLSGKSIDRIFPNLGEFSVFVEKNLPRDRNDLSGVIMKGRTRTGESVFCAVGVKEISAQGDEISYALLLHNFITEKDQQKQLLRKALQALPTIGVVVSDVNDIILHANEELGRIFGYAPQELIGKSLQCLMSEEITEDHKRSMDEYLRDGKETSTFRMGQVRRVMGVKKDNSKVPIILRLEDVTTSKGKEFYAFISDLTHEEEHHNAERLSSALLSLYPIPVMVVSNAGKVLTCSTSAASVMKLNKKKIIGTSISNFIRPSENLSSDGDHFVSVIQTKEEFLFRTYSVPSGVFICTIYRQESLQ